jgi:hypothetical protein
VPRKRKSVERVKADHELRLLGIDGVQGIGIGEKQGRPTIKVYVSTDTDELRAAVGGELEGFEIEIKNVGGEFTAEPEVGR